MTDGGSPTSNILVCSCGAISYSDNKQEHDNGGCSKNNQGAHDYKPYLDGPSGFGTSLKKSEGTSTHTHAIAVELSFDDDEEKKNEIPQKKEKKKEKKKEQQPVVQPSTDNKTRYKLNRADKYFSVMFVMYTLIGILAFMVIEHFTFVDAFYFRIGSLFNVGFGDIIPATNLGKVLNAIFMVIDMGVFVYIYWRIFFYVFSNNNSYKCLNNRYYVISCIVGILLLFLCGTLVICIGEGYNFLDGFLWNFGTISSVGYGHVIPLSVSAKIFCIFYIIFGYLFSLYLIVYAFYKLKRKYFDGKYVPNKPKSDDERKERTSLLPV